MISMALHHRNLGFDGRIFLTESEWRTYLRRMPVRYIKKTKQAVCEICGRAPDDGNELQNAHKIGFGIGIAEFAFTPDFLDGDHNIVTAHKRICNRKAELSFDEIKKHLEDIGVMELPDFLPKA